MSIVESMNQTPFVCVFDISDINVLILPKTHVLAGRTFMFFFPNHLLSSDKSGQGPSGAIRIG